MPTRAPPAPTMTTVPRERAWTVFRSNLGAIVIMLAAVGLQVVGAVLLKTLADHRNDWTGALLLAGFGGVLALNVVRLVVWGLAHRRYPLSSTFPLSSLFFPAMLPVAAAYGDEIGLSQTAGALLITAGSFWLSSRVSA